MTARDCCPNHSNASGSIYWAADMAARSYTLPSFASQGDAERRVRRARLPRARSKSPVRTLVRFIEATRGGASRPNNGGTKRGSTADRNSSGSPFHHLGPRAFGNEDEP